MNLFNQSKLEHDYFGFSPVLRKVGQPRHTTSINISLVI